MKSPSQNKNLRKRVLVRKLVLVNVVINVLVTCLIATGMIYGNYHNALVTTRQRLNDIGRSIVPSLINGIWQVDKPAISQTIDEIYNLPEVDAVRLQSDVITLQRGSVGNVPQLTRTYPLIYPDHGHHRLGTLIVESNLIIAKRRLQRQAIQIIVATFSSTLLGTLVLFLLIRRWITTPLETMSNYLVALRVETLNVPLNVRQSPLRRPDEIDDVAEAVNRMRKYLRKNVATLLRTERELRLHREELNSLVEQRTAELEEKTLLLQQQSEKFEKMANTDMLTGAFSRRFFMEMAEREMARRARNGSSLALMLIDIDYFKRINDTYGHAVGDDVLAALVRACQGDLREIDVLGRLGGEEFGVLLPDIGLEGAVSAAERLRTLAASLAIRPSEAVEVRFTVSIGLSTLSDGEETLHSLMERADRALYVAKNDGRNCVRISSNAKA